MRHRILLIAVVVLTSSLSASCRYLQGDPTPRPATVIAVPTSSAVPSASDTLEASLAMNDKCLLLVTKDDKTIVAIWLPSFVATLASGSGALGIYSGPDGDTNVAISGELMELRGSS